MMTAPTLDAVHKNPASVTGLSTQILTAMLMACNTVSTTLMTALLTSGSVRAETTIDNPQRLLRAAEVAEMLGIEPVSSSASPSRKSAKWSLCAGLSDLTLLLEAGERPNSISI